MENRNWKERIKATRDRSLQARGIILPKDDKENDKMKKDAGERDGNVFVEKNKVKDDI